MKASKIIGGVAVIIGLFLAICTADGSVNEMASRCAGVALCVAGGFVGGYFARPDEEQQDDNGYSKADDHNPYPEE